MKSKKFIIGLGNPGPKYADNRHNVGFMAIDAITQKWPELRPLKRAKFEGAQGSISAPNGQYDMILCKPQTYMNCSGQAVNELIRDFYLKPEHLIVIHDDIDLSPGEIRFKQGGGNGGHNGLRDIDKTIGNAYARIRIGVGRPTISEEVSNYVLHSFPKIEHNWLMPMLSAIADNLPTLLEGASLEFINQVRKSFT